MANVIAKIYIYIYVTEEDAGRKLLYILLFIYIIYMLLCYYILKCDMCKN